MVQLLIEELVKYGIKAGLLDPADEVYAANRLMELLRCDEFEMKNAENEIRPIHEILDDILDYAIKEGIMEEDTITAKDLFDTKIMGLITPPPSVVQ